MASVKVILYKHKTLKNGSHPILIQILKDRKRRTVSTGHFAKSNQWNIKQNLPSSKHPNQQLLISRLKRIQTDITDIILFLENKGIPFDVSDIINSYQSNGTEKTFGDYSQKLIDSFLEANKKGNANVYQDCRKSIMSFTNDKDIRLNHIDYKFVKEYQNYLNKKEVIVKKGTDEESRRKLSTNTISVYLRTFRAIVNKAIKDGLMEESSYPFKKISIKSQKTRKRAVNKDIIKMVEEIKVPENLQLYKDLFMFSFYNRGMNFVDMAFLKVKNIEGGRINYTRQKTGQQFSIKITDKAKIIIDSYNDLKDKDSYVFPIIYRKGKEYLDYKNAMRLMNKKLKKISILLNLDVPLSTYVARHSWATIAKRSGISTAIISEGLGHETEEITQVYLNSFENDVLDNANDLIIN